MAQSLLQCPFCPKTSSRGTGLASHIRGSHPAQYASWSKNRKPGANPVSRPAATASDSGFADIISLLEKQMNAIEAALTALREIGGLGAPAAAPAATPKVPGRKKRRGGMSPEGKARLIAALKRRWAERKAAADAAPAPKKAARRKKA
jgi:hypothetical protein